jgi:hypothetical protein
MQATDAIYAPHKTLPGHVLHLWHPDITAQPVGENVVTRRLWANQSVNTTNGNLSARYFRAEGNYKKMKALLDEFKDGEAKKTSDSKNLSCEPHSQRDRMESWP